MILAFFTALVIAGLFFLLKRDRAYLKKQPKEIFSKETRKYLNLPTPDAEFPQILTEKRPERTPSRRILDEMNEK